MALQFKRGTNVARQQQLLVEGEPFYVTDAATYGVAPVWIGDGVTFGGIASDAINLDELVDVTVSNPTNNQLLQWVTANGRWENVSNVTVPGTLRATGSATAQAGLSVTGLTTTSTLQVSNNATVNGSLTVNGGLNVNSPVANLNVTNLNVADNLVRLNSDVTGTPTENVGFEVERGTENNVAIRWNETDLFWETTTDGTNYLRLPNQSVGIGSSPTFADITATGNITATGDITSSGYVAVTNDITANSLYANSTVQAGAFTAPVHAQLVSDGTIPKIALTTANGTFQIDHNAGTNLISAFWSNGGGNRMQFSLNDQWFNSGKLGVNTATPAYELDVNGTARITGDLIVSGSTTTLDTTNLQIEDNIILLNKNEAGSGITLSQAGIEIERGPTTLNVSWLYNEVNGWWYPTGPLGTRRIYADNAKFDDLELTGDLSIAGDLTVVGRDILATSGGQPYITLGDSANTSTGTTTIPAKLRANSGLTAYGAVQVITPASDYSLYVDPTTGRVGIGTNTSTSTLGVAGDIHAGAAISSQTDVAGYQSLTAGNSGIQYTALPKVSIVNSDGSFEINNNAVTDLVSMAWSDGGGNRLQFDHTDQWFNTGKLGVNTNTPTHTLEVVGDANISTDLIAGNITSNGTLDANASYVTLNNADATLTVGGGVKVKRGSGITAEAIWDEATQTWQLLNNGSVANVNVNEVNGTAINIDERVRHNSVVKTTTSATPDQVVFVAPYKSVKLFVEVARAGEYQALEIIMLTNGTSAYMSQYGELITSSIETAPGTGIYIPDILATFSADYSGGLRLLVTPTASIETVITIATIAITS